MSLLRHPSRRLAAIAASLLCAPAVGSRRAGERGGDPARLRLRRRVPCAALILGLALATRALAQLALPGDETILHPSDPVGSGFFYSHFGATVALDGDLLAVGAPNDGVVTGGVDRGAVYVFERVGGSWMSPQKVVAPDGADDDQFGSAVDIAEGIEGLDDYLIVGAWRAARISAGFDGKVYLFYRTGDGPWTFKTQLTPASEVNGSRFGFSVAIDVSVPVNSQTQTALYTAVAGAYMNDDPNVLGNYNNGSISIFQLVGGPPTWQITDEFYGPTYNPTQDINLGYSAALDEGVLVVGAPFWNGGSTSRGQAQLYSQGNQLPAGNMAWNSGVQLEASDPAAQDRLGMSVAVSMDGGTGMVGTRYRASGTGAVYVFDLTTFGSPRTEVQILTASDGGTGQNFGADVDIDGRYAAIGAPYAREAGIAVGAIYLFEQTTGQPNSWVEVGRILATDVHQSSSPYGEVVAVSKLTTATGRSYSSGDEQGLAYVNAIPELIFGDGFASGNMSAWWAVVP